GARVFRSDLIDRVGPQLGVGAALFDVAGGAFHHRVGVELRAVGEGDIVWQGERPALVVVIGFERLGQVRDVVGPVVVVADEQVVDGGHLRSARAAAVLARGRIQSGDRGVGGIGQFPTGLRVAVFSA